MGGAIGTDIGHMTLELGTNNFIGIGITWNRRSMFDYGWISLYLPFISLTLEWPPDEEAFTEHYGLPKEVLSRK